MFDCGISVFDTSDGKKVENKTRRQCNLDFSQAVKDITCKQAIFRKDNKRAKRVIDLWREEIKIKGELEFFNIMHHELS